MLEEVKNKVISWFSLIIQNKKLMVLIGFFLVVTIVGVGYIAKDFFLNILSSQETFLGALFSEKSLQTTDALKNTNSSIAAPVKKCSFETSQTPQHNSIIFNEIAWMGNKESANNEWIEFKNIASDTVDVSGWSMINQNEKIKVIFKNSTKILPGDFYLIERGGTNFLPDIKAETFFTGSLKNSGDNFQLFDKDCNLIDQVVSVSSWPAGDNKTKKTMERDSKTFAWHTSVIVGGTPKKENTLFIKPAVSIPVNTVIKATELSITATLQSSPSQITLPNITNHLLVSEIMAGSDGNNNNAFIEFYNPTSVAIDLSGWTVKKKSSTGTESSLIVSSRFKGKIVQPGTYFLAANDKNYKGGVVPDITWPGSYALAYANNAILLYDNLGRKVEEISWTSIPKSQSYQRNSWLENMFHLQSLPNPQNSKSQ